MHLCAAATGGILNQAHMARDAEIECERFCVTSSNQNYVGFLVDKFRAHFDAFTHVLDFTKPRNKPDS